MASYEPTPHRGDGRSKINDYIDTSSESTEAAKVIKLFSLKVNAKFRPPLFVVQPGTDFQSPAVPGTGTSLYTRIRVQKRTYDSYAYYHTINWLKHDAMQSNAMRGSADAIVMGAPQKRERYEEHAARAPLC